MCFGPPDQIETTSATVLNCYLRLFSRLFQTRGPVPLELGAKVGLME